MAQMLRMSEEQFAAVKAGKARPASVAPVAAPKRTKFNATRVYLDRIEFDSKAEAERYTVLRLLERAGQIRGLVVHPVFPLIVNGVRVGSYKADFRYMEAAIKAEVIEDVKSLATVKLASFQRARHMVEAQYGVVVSVVMA